MQRLILLLAAAALGSPAPAQVAELAGKLEGDIYVSATGEFSLPLPVLRELGGTITDTPNVVTFTDSYNTHLSIACFPQDALQRWELETRGHRDYLLYFFTDFVLADFARRFPGSAIESARFLPEFLEGALITYALLPGGSYFEAKSNLLGPATAPPVTAKRGTLLFVRHSHVYVLSTELAERATRRSTYEATPEKENDQLTVRLLELTNRLVFTVPRPRSP